MQRHDRVGEEVVAGPYVAIKIGVRVAHTEVQEAEAGSIAGVFQTGPPPVFQAPLSGQVPWPVWPGPGIV